MDGKVNFLDITQLLGYRYNAGGTNAAYTDGDLDYNGKVDFFDIVTLVSTGYAPGNGAIAPTGTLTHAFDAPYYEYDPWSGARPAYSTRTWASPSP